MIDCPAGERKHLIAEEYLREHTVGVGVFLILVARAPTTVWKVNRSRSGVIRNLEKTRQYVNHYSFHIMDPSWGHPTIKMSGHPPFGAPQIILNGHEYVACQAQASGIGFAKEGNCFTRADEPKRLAQVADTLSPPKTIGRLSQVLDRWIYTACLCFGLDFAEQSRNCFSYAYSVYQVEYSRNLIFASGLKGYTKGEHVLRFEAIVHNTRALHTGRLLESFPDIVARLAAMVDRFTNMLDCVDVAFLPDGILDQLPTPSQIGATRVGGVDINRPRAHATMSAARTGRGT